MKLKDNHIFHPLNTIFFILFLLIPNSSLSSNVSKILILNSYHKGYIWTDHLIEGIEKTLDENMETFELYYEYMDTKRIHKEEYFDKYSEILNLKYRNTKLDGIIASDDDAFQFLLKRGEVLFKNTPVVFCGVNNFQESMIHGKDNFTGVVQYADIKETIDLALNLHPNVNKIFVISDATITGKGYQKDVINASKEYNYLEFIYLDGKDLTHAELLKKVQEIPINSIILLTLWVNDRNGEFWPLSKGMPLISNLSKVPVYGVIDEPLKYGLLGGKIQSPWYQGKKAAEILIRIIKHKVSPNVIPVERRSPNQYMFNYNQLKRWKIPESKLPEYSIIEDIPETFYSKYKIQVWLAISIFAILLVLIIGLSFSIIRHRRTSRFLRESEEKFKAITTSALDSIFIKDLNRHYTYINPFMVKILEASEEYLLGKRPEEIFDKEYAEIINELDARSFRGENVNEVRTISINNKKYIFNTIQVPMYDSKGNIIGITGIVRDLSEYIRAERSLKQIEWLLTRNAKSLEDMYNSSYTDLVALNKNKLILDSVGRDVLRDIVSEYLVLLETSSAIYEKNGDYACGLFSSSWCKHLFEASKNLCSSDNDEDALKSGKWLCHESCWQDASKSAIETGKPSDIECHGGIRIYAVPIICSNGEIIGAINFAYGDTPKKISKIKEIAEKYQENEKNLETYANEYESRPKFLIDVAKNRLLSSAKLIAEIVERKQAEITSDKLEMQLRQSQKMEAIGTLAGGIAHDFNNILTIIIGNIELSLDSVPEYNRAYNCLTDAKTASIRASEIIKQILSFSRQSQIGRAPINIKSLINESLKLVGNFLPSTIKIETDFMNINDLVLANPNQVNQVMLNLCANASTAMEDEGTLKIKISKISQDSDDCQTVRELNPMDYIKVSVSDNGCGIDPKIIDRIFEPYFTTKEVGEGSGMGLSVVYGIIKSYGGAVNVESQIGKGSTFNLYFPIYQETHKTDEIESTTINSEKNERILFIDDEDMLVEYAEKVLTHLGYNAQCQNDPIEALELFRSDPYKFDLVITDMTMPGLTGNKLSVEILKIRPDIPIILCTGYSDKIDEKKALSIGIKKIVLKPFTIKILSSAIREVLDKK
ncbi:MAG: response regulator [Desulfobacterales bacterium]|nr:response regulator [Desulfobacterales bacterium]